MSKDTEQVTGLGSEPTAVNRQATPLLLCAHVTGPPGYVNVTAQAPRWHQAGSTLGQARLTLCRPEPPVPLVLSPLTYRPSV